MSPIVRRSALLLRAGGMMKGLAESWALWLLMGAGCYGAGVGTGVLISYWVMRNRFRCYYQNWSEQWRKTH